MARIGSCNSSCKASQQTALISTAGDCCIGAFNRVRRCSRTDAGEIGGPPQGNRSPIGARRFTAKNHGIAPVGSPYDLRGWSCSGLRIRRAWAARLIILTAPPALDLPLDRASSILDLRVLAFTGFIALASALISAIAPAQKYSRSDLVHSIKSDSHRSSAVGHGFSAQAGLVVLQVAASVLLLVGAGLLTRTLWHASQVQLGFNPEHAVFASTDLIRQGYDKNTAVNLLGTLLDSLQAQPGIESAALGTPPMSVDMSTTARIEGHDSGEARSRGFEAVESARDISRQLAFHC